MASVLVRLSDNIIIANSDLDSIAHDPVTHELIVLASNPIPVGEINEKYYKDATGIIVKRPDSELVVFFEDERRLIIKKHLQMIQTDIALSQATKDAITGIIAALS